MSVLKFICPNMNLLGQLTAKGGWVSLYLAEGKNFIRIIFTISLIGCWEDTVQLHLIGNVTQSLWCLRKDYHCYHLGHHHHPGIYQRLCDQNI